MLEDALAHQARVGEGRERVVRLAHGEREAAGPGLHGGQHLVYLHAVQQILQTRRADADLHEAVGVAIGVVQRHADVLAQLAGYLVVHRLLHHRVRPLEQLLELEGLVLGVITQREVRIGRVRGHQAAGRVEDVDVLDLQRVGQRLQVVAGRERRVVVEHVAGHAALAQVALAVLRGQVVQALVRALDGLFHLHGAFVVRHRFGREREQRLHVERHEQDAQKAHEREHGRLAPDRLVVAQRPHGAEVGRIAAAPLLFAQDEDAVQDDHGHDREEDEQDDAHRDVARGGHVAFRHRRHIVRVADLGDAAVQFLAGQRHARKGPVFQVGHVDAAVDGVRAHQALVGMVRHQVVGGRHGEHEAVLADGDVLERAFRGAGDLDELAQLGRILLDHHHAPVVDACSVIAHEPVLFGHFHLDRLRGLAVVEHGAQLVEACIGEVRHRVLGACDHRAVAVHHQHVVDAQQVLVLHHLRVGGLEARVVVRHEGNALRLRLEDGIVDVRVLPDVLVRLGQHVGKRGAFLSHLLRVAVERQVGLHRGQQDAHDRHARSGDENEGGYLDLEFPGHAAPPSPICPSVRRWCRRRACLGWPRPPAGSARSPSGWPRRTPGYRS